MLTLFRRLCPLVLGLALASSDSPADLTGGIAIQHSATRGTVATVLAEASFAP